MIDDQVPSVQLSEPATELTAELLAASCQWTGAPAGGRVGEPVTIGLAPDGWQLGRPLPSDITATVSFDPPSSLWSLGFTPA